MYVHNTFYLSIHLLIDIKIVSILWLWWIMLLWRLLYKCLIESLLLHLFLCVRTQKWDCWVKWYFCVSFFEELPYSLLWWLYDFTSLLEMHKVPISSYPCQYLFSVFVCCFYNSLLNGCKMILSYISQMISDVEQIFMCLLIICIFSLRKCLFKSFFSCVVCIFGVKF